VRCPARPARSERAAGRSGERASERGRGRAGWSGCCCESRWVLAGFALALRGRCVNGTLVSGVNISGFQAQPAAAPLSKSPPTASLIAPASPWNRNHWVRYYSLHPKLLNYSKKSLFSNLVTCFLIDQIKSSFQKSNHTNGKRHFQLVYVPYFSQFQRNMTRIITHLGAKN
jgi:hypothetical protein